jgi:hypothetical protein
MSYFSTSFKNITGISTGTFVCDRVVTVSVNTGAASAVFKIYDGTTAGGTLIATIDATSKSNFVFFVKCTTHNLFYALSGGAADVTIAYD